MATVSFLYPIEKKSNKGRSENKDKARRFLASGMVVVVKDGLITVLGSESGDSSTRVLDVHRRRVRRCWNRCSDAYTIQPI